MFISINIKPRDTDLAIISEDLHKGTSFQMNLMTCPGNLSIYLKGITEVFLSYDLPDLVKCTGVYIGSFGE